MNVDTSDGSGSRSTTGFFWDIKRVPRQSFSKSSIPGTVSSGDVLRMSNIVEAVEAVEAVGAVGAVEVEAVDESPRRAELS